MEKLEYMPKIELHVHLDGSVRVDTLCDLSGQKKVDVERNMIAPSKCHNLNDYLEKFALPIKVMQTKDNLKRIAKEVALDLKKDNVIYAEVRFAPLFHTRQGLTMEDVVDSVLEGFRQVDISIGLILCMMRNLSFGENVKVITLAEKYLNHGVVGLDLAGAEGIYPTEDFKECFQLAKEKKIPFTIHAGEASGIDSIQSALEFGGNRLGHGIRVIEDEKVMDFIKKRKVTLEICPTSNVQTNVIQDYTHHPIQRLYQNGMLTTINTDNRTVSQITLTQEYQKLMKYFSFTFEDFKVMNLNAIEALFLSCEEKKKLKEQYLKEFALFLDK